jgi:LIVCS family branched-chain amino acid:cation transporter
MKRKEYFVLGFAMFSMFFGAGNLIFPASLGLLSGSDWIWALFGFLTTGVGLTFLGVYALNQTEGSAYKFAEKVSGKFSFVFNTIIILAIGPFLALPRTGAVTFEMGVLPFAPNFDPWIFGMLYFGLTIYLAINPSDMLDKLGKLLTPMILITMALIVGVGVFKDFGGGYESIEMSGAYIRGFFEGYQTMDALGSIIIAVVVIDIINARSTKEERNKTLLYTSIIAGALMALVYGGLMYLGSKTVPLYGGTEIGRTVLLTNLALLTLGNIGKAVLALLVAFACLTTSVGLAATAGNFFSKNTSLKYSHVVIASSVFSMFVANLGVDKIVLVSVPLLVLMYPICIVLIILNSFSKFFLKRGTYIGAVVGAGLISIIESLNAMNIKIEFLNKIYEKMPLSQAGYAFILPAVICGIVFTLIIKEKVDTNN